MIARLSGSIHHETVLRATYILWHPSYLFNGPLKPRPIFRAYRVVYSKQKMIAPALHPPSPFQLFQQNSKMSEDNTACEYRLDPRSTFLCSMYQYLFNPRASILSTKVLFLSHAWSDELVSRTKYTYATGGKYVAISTPYTAEYTPYTAECSNPWIS